MIGRTLGPVGLPQLWFVGFGWLDSVYTPVLPTGVRCTSAYGVHSSYWCGLYLCLCNQLELLAEQATGKMTKQVVLAASGCWGTESMGGDPGTAAKFHLLAGKIFLSHSQYRPFKNSSPVSEEL